MQPTPGFGQLDSLVDDIKKKESDRVKLESQVRHLRLRAEAQAADASELKAELEAAQAERMSLQKRIGLLTRKNDDLAAENGKLTDEKCDFQRSMANNEAKLKENEEDLRRAQREFVQELEGANHAYSRNRAVMKTILGTKGASFAEVPSIDKMDDLKAAAARMQETTLRVAELEARLRGVEAESQALKKEAAETENNQQVLRQEVATWKEKANTSSTSSSNGGRIKPSGERGSNSDGQTDDGKTELILRLQEEVAKREDTCARQADYINQLEEYANSVEAANAQLMEQQSRRGEDVAGDDGGQHYTAGEGPVPMSTDMDEDRSTETPHGGDSNEDQVYRAGGDM